MSSAEKYRCQVPVWTPYGKVCNRGMQGGDLIVDLDRKTPRLDPLEDSPVYGPPAQDIGQLEVDIADLPTIASYVGGDAGRAVMALYYSRLDEV